MLNVLLDHPFSFPSPITENELYLVKQGDLIRPTDRFYHVDVVESSKGHLDLHVSPSTISSNNSIPQSLDQDLLDRLNPKYDDLLKDSVLSTPLSGDLVPDRILPDLSNKRDNFLKKKAQRSSTTQNVLPDAGSKWFNMKSADPNDPKTKLILEMVKLRPTLYKNRYFKVDMSKKKQLHREHFQVGTLIGGTADHYSNLSKKQRQVKVEQFLDDQDFTSYHKKKFMKIQEKRESGGKKWYKKKTARIKRSLKHNPAFQNQKHRKR